MLRGETSVTSEQLVASVEPAAKSDVEPATKSDVEPATKSDVEPATKSDVEPAAKSDVEPAAKSDLEPAAKSDVEPAAKSDVEPAAEPPLPKVLVQAYKAPALGEMTLGERILKSDVIAKVRFHSATASYRSFESVVFERTTYTGFVHFTFTVQEVLLGTAPNSLVVEMRVWKFPREDGEHPARAASTEAVAVAQDWIDNQRDTSGDSRDAIVFLRTTANSINSSAFTGRPADVGYVFVGRELDGHITGRGERDAVTINSPHSKVWLPASSATNQSFLLNAPTIDTPNPPTISLANLKTRITAELARVDSSKEGHKECLIESYRIDREIDAQDARGLTEGHAKWNGGVSGRATGSVLLTLGTAGGSQKYPILSLQGPDSDLITSPTTDDDSDPNNGYPITLQQTRPLPAREYEVHASYQTYKMTPCGYINPQQLKWVVEITAPPSTLHELFFDPVTVGIAVSADATNGVLKPASFTDANGASATIESISYDSGAVEVEVDPHDALEDHIVDIIELDGTVLLSLDVDDATVDSANDTLSWNVESQPWEDGDLLMVRIHGLRTLCSDERVVPNAGGNPGLVSDCIALLMAKDALRGTAELNWGGDTAITDWTGIKVTGTPSRVTSLDLSLRGLDGSIPPGLGSLTGLDILSLDNNRLSGAIPPQLGSLTNLRFLYLYKNRLTGAIPAQLGSLASLNTMWLFNNQLTESIPAELEDLSNLERLGLDNNELTGCIPPELRDVPENDLGRLGLQDCAVPESVSTPTVTAGDESLDVSWTAPSEDGGSRITRYKIRYKRSADSSWTDGGTATTTDTPISGLVNATPYEVQVRACTVGGCGPWSASGTGTPRAPLTLPTVEDQSAKEGQAFSQALSEAAGGVAPYTYTVTGLRAGLTFEASTRTISGTPTASGDQAVTYTVTDSASGSAEQTFTIAVAAPSCSDTGLSSDCAVLLAAKDALRGTATLNWSTGTAVTSWDGVTLGGAPRRVTGLDLHGRNLTGSIPSGLSGLTHLQILRLYDNQLTGSIPWQLGSLTNLRILSISSNRLTGSIPTQLGSLTNLQTLLLANNRLTGSIPTQLGSLTNLRSLWLRGNQLTGSIPTQLGSLTELRTLLLDFNRLSGSIPSELTNLTRLITLWISENNLTGCIPPALKNVRFHDLDQLGLSNCASGTSGQPPSDSGGQPDSLFPPVFGQEAYSFTVSEDAATGGVVGSVVAEGPDGSPVAYRITGGNEAGRFSVGASGEITVAGSLDYETAASYTLTVAATEAYGGATATVTVEVIVTDVTEPSS